MHSNRRVRALFLVAAAATAGIASAGAAVADEVGVVDAEIGDALVIEREQPVVAEPVEIGDALVIEREQPVAAPIVAAPLGSEVEIGAPLVIEREQPVAVLAGAAVSAAAPEEPEAGDELVEDEVEIGDALVVERELPATPVPSPVTGTAPDAARVRPDLAVPAPAVADRPGHPAASAHAPSTEVLGLQHTRLAATGLGPWGQLLAGSALVLAGAAVRRTSRQTPTT